MLLRGRNTVGYTPYPVAGDGGVRRGGGRRPASTSSASSTRSTTSARCGRPSTRVRATGTAVAEVALCYTGDLSDPAETLYTLDYYLRLAERIVDGRRARPGDQGHGGPAARAGRQDAGHGAARAVRPAGAPAHPRHRRAGSSRPCWPRSTPGSTRSTPPTRPCPAAPASRRCRRWWPRPTTRPARPACRCGPCATSSPTGRPCAASTRRSSRACPRRPAASTATRSPAASSPTCASRRSRSGWARSSSRSRTCTRAANDILGNIVKVTPSSKVVGDLALHLVAVGADPRDFADNPGKYDIPDSVIGFLSGELGDPPGGWPEPFRTKALARPQRARARRRAHRPAARRPAHGPPPHPRPAALPRADQEIRGVAGDLRRPVGARHRRLPLRPAGRRGARRHHRRGEDAALRPPVDRRARPARHPHRHVHDQRPAPPDPGPRPVGRARRARRREGRPGPARARRRPVRRQRDPGGSGRATRSRPARWWPRSRR